MIKSKKKLIFRTPSVLSKEELNKAKSHIKKEILKHIKSGNKSFTVKDIFGYDAWDWGKHHVDINTIYTAWVAYYTLHEKTWTLDECFTAAYRQAAISLGQLVKQVVNEISDITFTVTSDGWYLVYKVV